ncbi:hypothetical protein AGLY_009327 [Aphis glycines]|uniref:Uncharacterized protein n=1 Tax=Aphis glycines TaxID=307491 RepID=A0A6G0TJC3_APHGL|nr:hypothetical protein AGLY_009327 [Aphis glycines]
MSQPSIVLEHIKPTQAQIDKFINKGYPKINVQCVITYNSIITSTSLFSDFFNQHKTVCKYVTISLNNFKIARRCFPSSQGSMTRSLGSIIWVISQQFSQVYMRLSSLSTFSVSKMDIIIKNFLITPGDYNRYQREERRACTTITMHLYHEIGYSCGAVTFILIHNRVGILVFVSFSNIFLCT